MKRVLITFTGSAYDAHTQQVCDTYKKFGATDFWIYDEPWLIESGFVAQNRWLWEHRGLGNDRGWRGYGWFSWKPFIIRDALARLDAGDMVLYLDADTVPIADFSVLYDLCHQDGGHLAFMATGTTHALCNRQWVKRECFQCMGLDEEQFWNGPSAVCRFMVFEKDANGIAEEFLGSGMTQQFLDEWQRHCLDHNCQTFDNDPAIQLPGPVGDGPEYGFREHRTEQAIYSLLCQKYGRRLYREACAFGNQCPQDWVWYPQLFVQHGSHGPHSLKGSRFRTQFPPGGKQ